jgi:nucleoside-diphosphate-sugar epimerase
MRILLTGGTGFLGSHIAEQLSSQGHQVRALVRRSSNRKHLHALPGVEFAEGTVEDPESLVRAVEGVDAVIHSAGLVKARSEEEFMQTNAIGTRNLVNAVRRRGTKIRRFVLVSSLAGIGPSFDGKPVTRDTNPSPVTRYGRSKLAGEKEALAASGDFPLTILRPPAIYGPRDVEIFAMFQAVNRGILPTIGLRDTTLSIIYGPDAADACVRALTADVPSGAAYFLDDGKPWPLVSMLEEIERALGKRARLRLHLPLPIVYAAALGTELFGRATNRAVMLTRDKLNEIRQPHWVCSSDDARGALGWSPKVQLPEGAALTAKWYREHGWL